MGNPTAYPTFTDEGLNYLLRTTAQHSHRATMESNVHDAYFIIGMLKLNRYLFGSANL